MPEMTAVLHGHDKEQHASSPGKNFLTALGVGTALITGAVILAPSLIPLLPFGNAVLASQAVTSVHAVELGTGLVKGINTALSAIPFVGHAIAQGGIASAVAAGGVGIGGVLLGQFIEKKENGKTGIKWGKILRYAALTTSLLIALPAVLSGVTMGIVYCCAAFSGLALATAAIDFLTPTLGAAGSMATIPWLSGAAAAVPHLLTCGAALIPALFSFKLASKKKDAPDVFPQTMQPYVNTVPPIAPYKVDSIVTEIVVDKPTIANVPCTAKLRLSDARTGLPITDDDLAITHTRKLHVYITDQSLKECYHIHPTPTSEPGVFTFSFTPQTSNTYNAWADFTLMKDGTNHRIKTDIPAEVKRNTPAVIRVNNQMEQDGLVFHWKVSEPLQKDTPSIVEVNVTDKQGNPITDLEPVMGAFAHLAGFSADGQHFIHTHPLGVEPASPDEKGGPRLRFHIQPEYAGSTQFYLQVHREGKDVFVPFGQQIKPSELATEKLYEPNHTAMRMA